MRVADSISGDPRMHAVALLAIVREMVAKNPENASEVARSISDQDYQAKALVHIAVAQAPPNVN